MHEASGGAVHETGYHFERAASHPAAPEPAGRPGADRAGGAAGDAFVGVALARLERDHVALLAALCELEGDTVRPAIPRDALRTLLREDLCQTQRALALAADGRYGSCEGCGVALASVVLLMQPATVFCPACAAAAERRRQVH